MIVKNFDENLQIVGFGTTGSIKQKWGKEKDFFLFHYQESKYIDSMFFVLQKQFEPINKVSVNFTTPAKNIKTLAQYKQENKVDENGESYYGQYDKRGDPNKITLSRELLGDGLDASSKMASVLSHENTHRLDNIAGRDSYEADAHSNGFNTYNDLRTAFELKGDSGFINQMLAGLVDPDSYIANSRDVDNYLLETSTGERFQDELGGINWDTPLGFADTPKEVDALNEVRKDLAWNKYRDKQFGKSGLDESEKENFNTKMSEEEFKNRLLSDSEFADEYDFTKIKPENLYRVGCKMYTGMYVAEALTGNNLDAVDVNQNLKDNNIYKDANMLYHNEYEKAIELLTDNKFDVEMVFSGDSITYDQVMEMYNSEDAYFVHIRYNGHSELVSSFQLDSFGNFGYVTDVETTNPWQYIDGQSDRSRDLARTNLDYLEIKRWDIFRATPIAEPWENYFRNLIP